MPLHTLAEIVFTALFIGCSARVYLWSRKPENRGRITKAAKDTW